MNISREEWDEIRSGFITKIDPIFYKELRVQGSTYETASNNLINIGVNPSNFTKRLALKKCDPKIYNFPENMDSLTEVEVDKLFQELMKRYRSGLDF